MWDDFLWICLNSLVLRLIIIQNQAVQSQDASHLRGGPPLDVAGTAHRNPTTGGSRDHHGDFMGKHGEIMGPIMGKHGYCWDDFCESG